LLLVGQHEEDDGMESKLPPFLMSFNFAGRLYLIRQSGHKSAARGVDEPFSCGFCGRDYGEQERYSTLRAEAADGTEVAFIFCAPCCKNATEQFPDMKAPAVERALAAKIERDGAAPRENV